MMKKFFLVLFLLPLITFSQSKLSPELLWKLGRVSDPQVSPDGKYVLYAIKTYDLSTNKGNTDIWRMEISGANATKLLGTAHEETSAHWLNANKIIYMSDESGDNQLRTMKADDWSKTQLTKTDGGINDYGFNAQGNMIWLTKDVKV